MIAATALEKRYGTTPAVAGVSLAIRPGEAFGLLGPNGAGKTTTIHMLTGAVRPDAGSVTIAGEPDPTRAAVRRHLGVAPQELAIYPELTAAENLQFFGRLYGLSGARLRQRVAFGLDFSGLADRSKHRASTFSGGMKRRLNLACALVHEPKVLFCDEPTVGVDPQSRNHVLESIEQLCQQGLTLVYTTHAMEEAQRLCNRVAILDHGKVLAVDTVPGLIAAYGGRSVVEAELTAPLAIGHGLPFEQNGTRMRAESDRPFEAIAALGKSGAGIRELRVEQPDLERVFLTLTGRRLRD